jgi:hypothetical protein
MQPELQKLMSMPPETARKANAALVEAGVGTTAERRQEQVGGGSSTFSIRVLR